MTCPALLLTTLFSLTPETPADRLVLSDTTIARINPLGLITFARFSYQTRLYDSDSLALRDNFVGLGLSGAISPAFGRVGLLAEVQPLTILQLWAVAEVIGYAGTFDLLQSFASPYSDYSPTVLEDRGALDGDDPQKNYATTGTQFSFGANFQIKVGPIAMRNQVRFSRPDYDLRDGDRVYYEILFDLLVPDEGWYVNDDLDVLYLLDLDGGAALIAGLRWTFARAFFRERDYAPGEDPDGDPNVMTHRLGPIVAYRFYSEPAGTSSFDSPTVLLVANWWLRHRYRTGQDVTQALPYLIVGFSFTSDLL